MFEYKKIGESASIISLKMVRFVLEFYLALPVGTLKPSNCNTVMLLMFAMLVNQDYHHIPGFPRTLENLENMENG